MADRFNIEVFIQNIKNINTILKQNLYIIENMKELMKYSNDDTAAIDEIKKDIASLETSVNKLTLLNYIDFPSGGIVTTSYNTNVYQIKAPFEMKTSETGEVINSGNFNFNLLIGGSDFISVELDATDSFLQIKLDQTKVDKTPLLNSTNLITSGGVAKMSPIIIELVGINSIYENIFANATQKRKFYTGISNATAQKRPLVIIDTNGYNYLISYISGGNTCAFLCPEDKSPLLCISHYNFKDKTFLGGHEINTTAI